MTAYLVARVDVHDMEQYQHYTALSPAAIAAFGGEFIVRGGDKLTLEGPEESRRMVIVRFPSMEQARACYESEQYQAAKAKRDGAATAQFVVLAGYDG